MTEKLDDIEKHISQQQQAYREEYENKKLEIAKHRENINQKLLKIEEDIAKVARLTAAARADRYEGEAFRRACSSQGNRRHHQQEEQ